MLSGRDRTLSWQSPLSTVTNFSSASPTPAFLGIEDLWTFRGEPVVGRVLLGNTPTIPGGDTLPRLQPRFFSKRHAATDGVIPCLGRERQNRGRQNLYSRRGVRL